MEVSKQIILEACCDICMWQAARLDVSLKAVMVRVHLEVKA